jgi:drug/metabolite transporter (DMT)-like permease
MKVPRLTEHALFALNGNYRGILALIGVGAALSLGDAMMKLVARSLPVGEMLFVRGVLTIVCFVAVLSAFSELKWIWLAVRPVVLVRAILDASASACFFIALPHMRIADLSAVTLASPLLITLLAVFIYKESVGWRRWTAILVGAVGTLFIIKPTLSTFNPWALFGVGTAICAALRDLTMRRIDPGISSFAIALLSTIALTLTGWGLDLGNEWSVPRTNDLWLLAGAAISQSFATYLGVIAFRGAVDFSVVVPFRYTSLLWAGIAGYSVFGELPDNWTLLGAALIAGSGVYALRRAPATVAGRLQDER